MSWDNLVDNAGYWVEVATARMARRALHTNAKSLTKMAEDESIAEWIGFMPEKSLTKTLRRDVEMILAKKLAEKAVKATHNQDKSEKVCPEDAVI